MNKIQFKLETNESQLPKRATDGSAGFDLYAPERVDIPAGASYLVDIGVSMAIPNDWMGQINPRSSMAVKRIRVGARIIDSDYRGTVKINLHNDSDSTFEIMKGDRIAQLVVVPVLTDFEVVEYLTETERNDGGFGSTGK